MIYDEKKLNQTKKKMMTTWGVVGGVVVFFVLFFLFCFFFCFLSLELGSFKISKQAAPYFLPCAKNDMLIYFVNYSYLPTPPLGQDITQGQFLSGF